MNTFVSILLLSFPLMATNHYRSTKEQDIPVMVTGLQPGKGQIILNIFKDNDSYKEQMPFRKIIFDKALAKNGYMTVSISLPEGANRQVAAE